MGSCMATFGHALPSASCDARSVDHAAATSNTHLGQGVVCGGIEGPCTMASGDAQKYVAKDVAEMLEGDDDAQRQQYSEQASKGKHP